MCQSWRKRSLGNTVRSVFLLISMLKRSRRRYTSLCQSQRPRKCLSKRTNGYRPPYPLQKHHHLHFFIASDPRHHNNSNSYRHRHPRFHPYLQVTQASNQVAIPRRRRNLHLPGPVPSLLIVDNPLKVQYPPSMLSLLLSKTTHELAFNQLDRL